MRAIECACGQHLAGANDDELFERVRIHMDREHPDKEIADEQILNLIEARAYDTE